MEGREQSEFNMAVSYLTRLNVLFYAADEAAMELNTYNWLHALMALFRELSTEMKDEEIDDFNKDFEKVGNLVNANIKNQSRTGKGEVPTDVHKALHDLEIELRKILKSAGLQLKMMEDARNSLK